MEYDGKKLKMEEKVVKAKARAEVLSTFGDAYLQKYKKEDQQLLTEEDNSEKKTRENTLPEEGL